MKKRSTSEDPNREGGPPVERRPGEEQTEGSFGAGFPNARVQSVSKGGPASREPRIVPVKGQEERTGESCPAAFRKGNFLKECLQAGSTVRIKKVVPRYYTPFA